jgi:hypothetical protein
MGKSAAIKLLQVALTPEEQAALNEIAETEHVSMASIVRDLLAEKYPQFEQVHRPRSGYGGQRAPRET